MSNLNNMFIEEYKMKEWIILLKNYSVLNMPFNIDVLFAGKFYIRLQKI